MLPLLHALHHHGAQRLTSLQASQRSTDVQIWVDQHFLEVLHSPIGQVVVVGAAGHHLLGQRPRLVTARTASEQIALREAAEHALTLGYLVESVASNHLRLRDQSRREHLLYIRLYAGLPKAANMRDLARKHRSTLERSGGTLILCVLQPEQLPSRVRTNHKYQFWPIRTSSPP